MDGNGTHGLQNTSPAHIFTLLWLRGSTRVQVDLVNALGPLTQKTPATVIHSAMYNESTIAPCVIKLQYQCNLHRKRSLQNNFLSHPTLIKWQSVPWQLREMNSYQVPPSLRQGRPGTNAVGLSTGNDVVEQRKTVLLSSNPTQRINPGPCNWPKMMLEPKGSQLTLRITGCHKINLFLSLSPTMSSCKP